MQEHPVPQNVTGYEFHLIGQMTLKQFTLAASGIGIAFLIHITPIPSLFQLPLMGIFALGGIALAFVPYEGRSLDRWFFAFLHSIYAPTMYFWHKTKPVPEAFTYVQNKTTQVVESTFDYTNVKSARVSEFLQTMSPTHVDGRMVEQDEETKQVDAVLSLFTAPAPTTTTTSSYIRPANPNGVVLPDAPAPVQVTPTTTEKAVAAAESAPAIVVNTEEITSVAAPKRDDQLTPATTSSKLPFPKPPAKPNMIVGMVFSKDEKIIDNAIVEIIHQPEGTPVRALKTNALGQFAIITALENGPYEITVEKEGYKFDNLSITLSNQVVQPLLVQAK